MDKTLASTPLVLTAIFATTFLLLKYIFITDIIITIAIGIAAGFITTIIVDLIPNKKIDPKGKAVFITGCDTGFGNELAKRLDALGFHVYAGCLFADQEGAQKLKKECSDKLRIIQMDVSSDEQVKEAAKEVENSLDGKVLWSVVNNAGINIFSEIEWCSMENYNRILNVNALGPVRVTKAFLPLLRKSQGRVVIVTSFASRFSVPALSAYCMSKYAALSFADGLRREMKKWNVSVHTIEPTSYRTNIIDYGKIESEVQKSWDTTPSEIREAYGEDYFQALKERAKPNFFVRKNIHEVIDDLVDAIAGEVPKIYYVPTITGQLQSGLFLSLPTKVADYIFTFICQPKLNVKNQPILKTG